MADRNSEIKPDSWRAFLRRSTHVSGVKVDNVNSFEASERQTQPIIDLNNPNNKTRETQNGIKTDRPIYNGRTKPLQNTAETKNLLP